MRYSNLLRSTLLLLPVAAGFSQTEPNYSGTWRLQSDNSVKLVLEQKDGAIHVKEFKGAENKADYACNTLGKECNVKTEGHAAKVSFWFNGSKLVELETRGNNVLRRRFQLADNDSTLNVELSSIVPVGKDEKLAFARDHGEQ